MRGNPLHDAATLLLSSSDVPKYNLGAKSHKITKQQRPESPNVDEGAQTAGIRPIESPTATHYYGNPIPTTSSDSRSAAAAILRKMPRRPSTNAAAEGKFR